MKKKISVLGLILAAAFVLFTSCEDMLHALPGESFTIGSNETTPYGTSQATLRITNYNKVLGMGLYEFTGPYEDHHGIIKVNKILRQVELKGNSGSTPQIQIINKTIKIGTKYTFDISKLL